MPPLNSGKFRKLVSPSNWPAYAFRARNRIGRAVTGKTYILIERRAGIGDIICTFPAVITLRKKYPRSHIVYATRKDFAAIVRLGQCADAVIELDDTNPRPWMAESDFDLIYRPRVADEKQPPIASVGHLVDQMSAAFGVEPHDRQPRLYPSQTLQSKFRNEFKTNANGKGPTIGIHAGPTWPVKEWIPAEWDRLAGMLREQLGATLFQLGSDVDTGRGPIKSARVAGAVDWVNRFSLEESTAAISQLDLFIGIDSGLLHIAGGVGTRSVGLYGAISPTLSLPPTTPAIAVTSDVPCLFCHHKLPPGHWRTGCPNDIICMKQLTAERVLGACQQILFTNPLAPRTAGVHPGKAAGH